MKIVGNYMPSQHMSFKSGNVSSNNGSQPEVIQGDIKAQIDKNRTKLEYTLDSIASANRTQILGTYDKIMQGEDAEAKALVSSVIGSLRPIIVFDEKQCELELQGGVKATCNLKRMQNGEYHKDWVIFQYPDGEKQIIKYKYSPEKKSSLEQINLVINQDDGKTKFSKVEYTYFDDFSLRETKETEISASEAQSLYENIIEFDMFNQFKKSLI